MSARTYIYVHAPFTGVQRNPGFVGYSHKGVEKHGQISSIRQGNVCMHACIDVVCMKKKKPHKNSCIHTNTYGNKKHGQISSSRTEIRICADFQDVSVQKIRTEIRNMAYCVRI